MKSGLALPNKDLTIEKALAQISKKMRHNYKAMYDWFIEGTDLKASSRLLGERLPGVDPNFTHCAQRGIHTPSKQRYAASITIRSKSIYSDGDLDGKQVFLEDGTWLLFYQEHRNNIGNKQTDTWMNEKLLNCWSDGIPVGVFIQENSSSNYKRALAYVEDFDPTIGLFTLHGPIRHDNNKCFSAFSYGLIELPEVEEMQEDTREIAPTRIAARKGQAKFKKILLDAYNNTCTVTGGTALPTLQGAHIIDYRGEQSNIVQNGLLLRADIHLLYDKMLLSIEPDTHSILISETLVGTEYEEMFGSDKPKRINEPNNKQYRPNDEYLNVHHQRFLASEKAS